MSCTTILVGKKASNDGSTMIARNDDGYFDVKKLIVNEAKKGPFVYESKIGHLKIEIAEDRMRYTSSPSVDDAHGLWEAMGINEANVAMTATETITSNSRVLAADPMVRFQKGKDGKEDIPGGIGEEDLVTLVLPYIHSAKEGVLRLGALLEKYGTYEANGIAFSDHDEIWWLETIGGHHWISKKVRDDQYVIMPNQFGLDNFDFSDAFGEQRENLCSSDLKEFVEANHLNLQNDGGSFNPRLSFGSRTDADHVYNTPRAWFMGRYFNNLSIKWDGPDAQYNPESDNIPWALVPDRKITIDDVKYILSSYFQGTKYNPYQKADYPEKGIYRPIGISRTGLMAVLQLRNDVPEELSAIEWICFGSNAFNGIIPVFTNVNKMPAYLSDVTLDVSTNNFYWNSRLIGALVDPYFGKSIMHVERYQAALINKGRNIIQKFDKDMISRGDYSLTEKANEEVAKMADEETKAVLAKVLLVASEGMKNSYSRSDN